MNSRHRGFAVIALLLGVLVYVIGTSLFGSSGYQDISPQEAQRRMAAGEDIILLDVRTPAENAEIRIPNSLLIPVDDIEREALSRLPDKKATIFVYCRSGRRSVTASIALVKMGYKNVYNLGGIIDWPYETESGY